jgi:hypothetical protein
VKKKDFFSKFNALIWGSVLALNILFPTFCKAEATPLYTVKKGDCLSEIIHTIGFSPIYGKSGYLEKIIKLNPQIQNPNMIFKGTEIFLPEIPPQKPSAKPRRLHAKTARKKEIKSDPSPPIDIMEKNTISDDSYPHTEIGFRPNFSYSRIEWQNTESNVNLVLLSDLNPGAVFHWDTVWSEKFRSQIRLGFSKINFRNTAGNQITNNESTYTALGATITKSVKENLTAQFSATYKQQPSPRLSGSTIIIDKANISELGLGGNYTFFKKAKFASGVDVLGFFSPRSDQGSYNLKSGFGLETKIHTEQYIGTQTLSSSVFYRRTNFTGSNNTSFRQNEAGIEFGYSRSFQ